MFSMKASARHATIAFCWLALAVGPASAGGPDPFVGKRVDKPDGSASLSLGRRLPADWDAKLGVDLQLAPTEGPLTSEDLLLGSPARDRSSGMAWMNMVLPGIAAPFAWDKATLDARLDPAHETGKFGTTLDRTLPLGAGLALTLQDGISVTESLESGEPAIKDPLAAAQPAAPLDRIWSENPSLRVSVLPTGTALTAGSSLSTADNRWHHKVSAEQKLWGPLDALNVTASVTDPGTATSNRSITAGFKRIW